MVVYAREWNGKKRVVGSTVNAWEPSVATLPDLREMESITYISELDIQKIAPGSDGKAQARRGSHKAAHRNGDHGGEHRGATPELDSSLRSARQGQRDGHDLASCHDDIE